MTKIKAAVKAALELVNDKQSLKSRRENLELEIGNVKQANETLRTKIIEANGALQGYQEGFNKGEPEYTRRFNTITEQKLKLQDEFKSGEVSLRKLMNEFDDVCEKLTNHCVNVDVAMIKESKTELQALQEELINCEFTLAEKQNAFIAFTPMDNTLEMLEQRKQMLVDDALGGDKKIDIEKIDNAIAEQQEKDNLINASDRKKSETEQQTIAGLQGLVNELTPKVNIRSKQHNELMKAFFISMASNDIENYKKAAASIETALHKLLGATEIIKQMGLEMDSNILPYGDYGRWNLAIPGFTLEDKKLVNISSKFDDHSLTVDRIKDELKEKGVEL